MARRLGVGAEPYELRGAQVRKARNPRPCDAQVVGEDNACPVTIHSGEDYAYVSTGLAFCQRHWSTDDVVEAP